MSASSSALTLPACALLFIYFFHNRFVCASAFQFAPPPPYCIFFFRTTLLPQKAVTFLFQPAHPLFQFCFNFFNFLFCFLVANRFFSASASSCVTTRPASALLHYVFYILFFMEPLLLCVRKQLRQLVQPTLPQSRALQRLRCQYWYLFTSKASKLGCTCCALCSSSSTSPPPPPLFVLLYY